MRYARIENNCVAEFYTTDADINAIFHPSLVWVPCTDDSIEVGYTYNETSKTFSQPIVDPTAATAGRVVIIRRELEDLDLRSVRSLRAKIAGAATAEDERILSELEARASALRTELASLV